MKRAAITLLVLIGPSLLGCAAPAESGRMTVTESQWETPFPRYLLSAMCVRNVTGGEDTNPLWVSKVGDGEFKEALTATLRGNGLLADPDACRYSIDVNLLGLAQPYFAFDVEVVSHANYKVYTTAGSPILLETIAASFTVRFADSIMTGTRIRLANEGAIHSSIEEFLRRLRGLPADLPLSS